MDLAVFAVAAGADEATARAVMEACYRRGEHVEGDLDERIVAFYEDLRAAYPDIGPGFEDSPWSSRLEPGIDHVFMNIRWSADNAVLDLIQRLAREHGLVLYDPQDDTVYLPPR
jgi:hypothetical protein